MTDQLLKDGFDAVAKSLAEFGYSGTTAVMIAEAYRKYKSGEAPAGIVEMMATAQFEECPKIFGVPA